MNTMRIFVFVVSVFSVVTQGQVHDVVLCKAFPEQQTIQCGLNQIIGIQSVTLANLYNLQECSVDLITNINRLVPLCKRRSESYGKDVYSRCYGEHSCTVDGSIVDKVHIGCSPFSPFSTVMWFKYRCHNVDAPSVALLPLPENREVRGFEVEIFSPYYPCYIPRSDRKYILDCKVTPHRKYSDSYITYRVIPKYIEILQNTGYCQDKITFDHGSAGGEIYRRYCGWDKIKKEWWKDDEITSTSSGDFHIKYSTTPNGGDGTKFWFIATAEENGEAIELSVTCTGQEKIPPLPPNSTCSPFRATNTTTRTTMTTTTTDSGALSSGGEGVKQSSNGGSVGSLIAALVVIVIVVVIAIVMVFKLRKYKKEKQEVILPKNILDETTNQADVGQLQKY